MPLSAAQLITLATQTAKCPSFTSQAGAFLNLILSDLCQDYDFAVARGTINFNFNSSAGQNQGPYTLPADWLRANRNDVFYSIQGVQYVMIAFALAEFDACVEQPGLAAYPENYAVDNSPIGAGGAPLMYVWPPAGGSYAVTARYFRQMPDIATPETSAAVPWFPNQTYLRTRLTGELMQLVNDDRAELFLKDAQAILDRYLKLKDDADVAKRVSLDRRFFGGNRWNLLPNTKTIGF